ncbi:MAG: glycerol kinase GlpK [Coriobacteriia bacterium]|nr:glycerol kinase GlpK [Coriobacteriia bacterium]
MREHIVAFDQGTTSSRTLLINRKGQVIDVAQRPIEQHYPRPGWVEHDPQEILATQLSTFTDVLVRNGLSPHDVDSIGITNQRETTVVWNRHTGEAVFNAIVWQCRRTAPIIDELCADPEVRERITATTGLVPDAYFSASKIKWILDNVPGAREQAEAGDLLFGTIDCWLVWCLTNGAVHATDVTNASRTMLFDIHTCTWDPWLLELFGVPVSMLPDVLPSSGLFGTTAHPSIAGNIPICGVAGDQQAALFGQCCFNPGEAKNTYGTGCFLLMNTGNKAVRSKNGLVTTITASAPSTKGVEYALEGSVFMAGALIQWLVEELGIIESAKEVEALATSVEDTAGVYVVPAFTGLGAPYWDADARGAIYGLTRGAGRAHIARACLDALAYQMNDLIDGMVDDSGIPMTKLSVDGGASRNGYLMQFQAGLSQLEILRPKNTETTAMGAAYLAGLATGFWPSIDEIRAMREVDARFVGTMGAAEREAYLKGWRDCIRRTRTA